jgi:hypothetical protein
LRDNDIGRKALADIDGRRLGVSIGFTGTKSWTVDRDGLGCPEQLYRDAR